MSRQFDRYSTDYDEVLNAGLRVTGEDKDFFASARVRWTARLIRALDVPSRTVLDFGCGTGATAPLLARELHATSVIGVDESSASIDEARRSHASDGVQFSVASEFMAVDAIDVVYVNGVFHHVPRTDQPATLARIASALRPGGVLALWENNPYNPGTRWVMKRLPFDRDAVMLRPAETRRLVQGAGLRILCTEYCFFFPHALGPLRPLEPLLRRVPLGGQYIVLAQRIDPATHE